MLYFIIHWFQNQPIGKHRPNWRNITERSTGNEWHSIWWLRYDYNLITVENINIYKWQRENKEDKQNQWEKDLLT